MILTCRQFQRIGITESVSYPMKSRRKATKLQSIDAEPMDGKTVNPRRCSNLSNTDQHQSTRAVTSSGRIETFDVVQLAEVAKPWNVRLHQIAPGRFHGEIQYVEMPDVMIYEEHCSQPIDASGASPEGFFMLGTSIASHGVPVDWCGKTIDRRNWACSPSSGEVAFATPEQAHQVVLLVRSELLARALGREVAEGLAKQHHLRFSAEDGDRLAAAITGLVRCGPDLQLPNAFLTRSLQSTLLETLRNCTAKVGPYAADESIPLRRVALRRAIECVDQLVEPITAMELALAVDVCQRTLEYGFREVLGITPASYLRMHRLNRARHELSSADPKTTTVTQVAFRWGFYHPGRFSASYGTLFGEKPSTTLARARHRPSLRLVDVFLHAL